jgi:uncharacterized phiE125 gp8 family phage protein
MGLKLVTPPAVEPVTLAEAKTHLRLDTAVDDSYVSALITAARERVELFLRRALITQVFEFTVDDFPAYDRAIDLPRPPLRSVEWIKYVDTSGVLQTVAPDTYTVDASSNEIGRVALAWNRSWPFTRYTINAVTVRFTAGYGEEPGDVPQAIRHAILIETANLYENREDTVVGQAVNMLSVSERLLWPYRALGAE